MSEKLDSGLLAGADGITMTSSRAMARARRVVARLAVGLACGMWVGGGPDRYGEADGIVGGLRGAGRTLAKSGHYLAASLVDLVTWQRSAVRNLGLAQQVETRLWQDKRLVAEGIVVEVAEEGTAVLKGLVLDQEHKEKAVALARDTRGVERVVDQLAVSPATRTIESTPAAPVPTGVASGVRVVR